MNARERLRLEREKALSRAEKVDKTGVVVIAPGTWAKLETLPPGSKVRTSTGVILRLERLNLGSATVVVVKGGDGWKKGDRYPIARTAILEVA